MGSIRGTATTDQSQPRRITGTGGFLHYWSGEFTRQGQSGNNSATHFIIGLFRELHRHSCYLNIHTSACGSKQLDQRIDAESMDFTAFNIADAGLLDAQHG